MPVIIEIQNLQKIIPINAKKLTGRLRRVLTHEKIKSGKLSFVFVTDVKIRALNKKFLRHDFSTDVLTFPDGENPPSGEVIISVQTARRNAAAYDTDFHDEVFLYMIHGILHLLGYDDHRLADVKKIRAKEMELMHLSNI